MAWELLELLRIIPSRKDREVLDDPGQRRLTVAIVLAIVVPSLAGWGLGSLLADPSAPLFGLLAGLVAGGAAAIWLGLRYGVRS